MPSMPTYTLINPHDPYTFDAPDDDIAETVVALLGGSYGWQLEDVDPPRTGGMFNLLDADGQQTATDTINRAMARKPELAAALRTVAILEADRAELDVDPDVWHQQRLTSSVDLRASAHGTADAVDNAAAQEATPDTAQPSDPDPESDAVGVLAFGDMFREFADVVPDLGTPIQVDLRSPAGGCTLVATAVEVRYNQVVIVVNLAGQVDDDRARAFTTPPG